jgi:hypothetical protein
MKLFRGLGKFTKMINTSVQLQNELRRLEDGLLPNERPGGVGAVVFIAICPHDADVVLRNVKEVLKSVDSAALTGWRANQRAKPNLPSWFVVACANPMSAQQAEQRLKWRKGLSRQNSGCKHSANGGISL